MVSEFSVGDKIMIEDNIFHVAGKILYRNTADDKTWFEYKLKNDSNGGIYWLSYDDCFKEYSISVTGKNINGNVGEYHVVDKGREVVVNAWGNVDVDIGESAYFEEYEDITEEYIMSSEKWSDGTEISYGHYVDLFKITLLQHNENRLMNINTRSASRWAFRLPVVLFIFFISSFLVFFMDGIAGEKKAISNYLKNSANYEYSTSITDEKEKADVYKTFLSTDEAAKNIIDGIDGNTVDVSQNTEDDDTSIGLLTKYEYCFIYTSEDGETLVQVSTRKYAYTGRQEPYRSRLSTRRYYRRYYYSYGYGSDSSSYGNTSSDYSNYSDTKVTSSDGGTYNTYSSSVRQASAARRASSGGGTSSGK